MTFKHCVNTPNALELRKFAIEELIKKGKELEGGKKLTRSNCANLLSRSL